MAVPVWKVIPIGLLTGALSGLLGVGGGIVMVPALVSLGYARHIANATSLSEILLVALAGAWSFLRAGSVDLWLGVMVGIAGVVGAGWGAKWAHRTSADALGRVFGILLLVVGAYMAFGLTFMVESQEILAERQRRMASWLEANKHKKDGRPPF